MGGDFGGRLIRDRLWFWASRSRYLQATITKATGWSIASLAAPNQPDVSFFAGHANTLTFYPAEGSISPRSRRRRRPC